ncbi:MAG: ornithine cyclodeaminase family protein [Conexivisphaera sp.]
MLRREEVLRVLSMRDEIAVVEEAFREKGENAVQMPPKQYLFLEEGGDLRVMPAYLPRLGMAGVKVVNSHPRNREKGLPSVMAVIELVDPSTGRPLALLDGTEITAFRTGAASAVATKYLSREDSRCLCVVGAGAQSRRQLDAILEVRDIGRLLVYDVVRGAAEGLAGYARSLGRNLSVEVTDGPRECVEAADVLVTATPAREPVVRDGWVRPGTHINAIGADAPGKEELDPAILLRSKIVVDDYEQTIHSGEINVPISRGILRRDQIYGELGEIVAGRKPGRTSRDEVTVFDSTGVAILDVATAFSVMRKAAERGLGITVTGLGL